MHLKLFRHKLIVNICLKTPISEVPYLCSFEPFRDILDFRFLIEALSCLLNLEIHKILEFRLKSYHRFAYSINLKRIMLDSLINYPIISCLPYGDYVKLLTIIIKRIKSITSHLSKFI